MYRLSYDGTCEPLHIRIRWSKGEGGVNTSLLDLEYYVNLMALALYPPWDIYITLHLNFFERDLVHFDLIYTFSSQEPYTGCSSDASD